MHSADSYKLNLPTLLARAQHQGTLDMPDDSHKGSWHVMLMVPSTHRSEIAPPIMCTERNLQTFHPGGSNTVACVSQEHRLLGEQATHIRNSEVDQLRIQLLEVSL